MNQLRPILLVATAFAFTATSQAQTTPPVAAPGAKPAGAAAPGAPAQKPKPFSSSDTRAYLTVAESLQFQLNMSLRLRSRFKETEPQLVAFGSKLHKEATDLWTPGVDLAQLHGVDGKKIPLDMTKADKANVAKLNPIKDDKQWTLAYFELFAKDSKKNALEAEKTLKTVMDPELKAFLERAQALLKSQSETVEAKFQELKVRK
ncbi:MAG: hypothetical protein ABMA01_10540 [Chthoniobacteraceae bacterium]